MNNEKPKSVRRSSFTERGSSLYHQLLQIVHSELGVIKLQNEFNSLKYMTVDNEEEVTLRKMTELLEDKLKLYSKLVIDMSEIVQSDYHNYQLKRANKKRNSTLGRKNQVMDFTSGADITDEETEYYPCCIIPDHYLIFNRHFGTRVNTELWCNSGIEQDKLYSSSDLAFIPRKLTDLFSVNFHLYPNIKWQFFMLSGGEHTEFPAHRSGTSIGSGCGQSSRHRGIYEKTIHPGGRNIVLLYDLGHTMRPQLLLTAKAIGYYVIDTLTAKDNIAVLGVAKSVLLPSPDCLSSSLVPAGETMKRSFRKFIDFMTFHDVSTNHSLGLDKAMEIIENWTVNKEGVDRPRVLLAYITRGILEHAREASVAMETLSNRIRENTASVVISAFALGLTQDELPAHTQFLVHLVNQDFGKYDLTVNSAVTAGEIIAIPSTLQVASLIRNFYDVVEKPQLPSNSSSGSVRVSEIYWDEEAHDMVLTFSRAVHSIETQELIGLVGIDLSLSFLLEDAAYYTTDRGYAMVLDSQGKILSHPKMGRGRSLNFPLMFIQSTLLETSQTFLQLSSLLPWLPSGHKKNEHSIPQQEFQEYWWRKSQSLGWIFVISREGGRHNQKLSPDSSPLSPGILFHRLDLLSPQEAKVCRYFNQMATLDGPSLFLSSGTYSSASTHFAEGTRNLNVDLNVIEFLTGRSPSLVGGGLKEGIKAEVSALSAIADFWKDSFQSSNLQKYIIRRYVATPSGVTLTYPGTLMDASYDPTVQGWFIKAMEKPGEIVVTPPLLDPGGAGYVITVSHTVYQGKATALHSSADPVMAVLAADFTLGFWLKLLADIEPACASSIYFSEFSPENDTIRCFLMDTSGYLIVHSSFLHKLKGSSSSFLKHITHQEPVLSMALLGKGVNQSQKKTKTPKQVLKKIWCSKQWLGVSERYYSIDLRFGQLVTESSDDNQLIAEKSCLQYKVTAVPSSNLILGFINQTCLAPTAFCPCSTVERPCLNCQFMEDAACECPCECVLPSEPCLDLPPIPKRDNIKNTSIAFLKELLHAPVSCPQAAEVPATLHYGVGMLAQLSACLPVTCAAHTAVNSCLGVVDCVWCVFSSDGNTPLDVPHCTQSHKCFGGIMGAPSPYPPGLAPLPHSEERGTMLPVVPVVGGILVVFLVLGLAIYAYKSYSLGSQHHMRTMYTPTSAHLQTNSSPLFPPDVYQDIEKIDENLEAGGDVSFGSAAAMSPYRMNPTYKRPHTGGEASDPGYSTMTPHEDSDNVTYTDLYQVSSSLNGGSSSSWLESSNHTKLVISENQNGINYLSCDEDGRTNIVGVCGALHSPLSSPKKIGPNKLIVPVTVHMVDSL